MNSLYITSVERYSGKTAVCLALGKRMKSEGIGTGYMKPLSLQPFRLGDQIVDEDAAFVKNVLELSAHPAEISPVVVTPDFLRDWMAHGGQASDPLIERVRGVYEKLNAENEVMILEGGASLREGYVVGLPTVAVASALGAAVLVVVKYRDEVRVLDDCLAARTRLDKSFIGVVINRAPKEEQSFLKETAAPHLERNGVPVYGILPDVRSLAALTVQELADILGAESLTRRGNMEAMVENVMVGAMTAEAALSRFRKQSNKAVITGGDRTDIQLAALETSTACIILTGNLRPSPLVVRQAEEFGVAILLVRGNTMETIESIERVFGKTRLGQASKLHEFEQLMEENFDYPRLFQALRDSA
jgi:uncharacterized protein